jgi:outer membrane protein assembly factor BamB
MRSFVLALPVAVVFGCINAVEAGSWPQFRGPGGAAVAVGDQKLPADLGPERNVIWKTELPPGHSSPVIHDDRIFLTAVRGAALLTIGLDRMTGKVVWEAEAPHQKLEKIHKIGSYAQSTPVTDGSHVVSFFGSCGLFCYDTEGKLLWQQPMGPFKSEFGAASSPLLRDGRVLVCNDQDSDSFLLCLDVNDGKPLWKVDRSEFPVSYASPVIWEVAGKKQVVASGTLRIAGYDFETGKELWTVRGMARVMNMTPSVSPDGTLYVAGWAAGADANDRFKVPSFAEMIAKHDANQNGTLEPDELPAGPMKERFPLIDRDKSGHITEAEWEGMRQIFHTAQNRMVAIKPGGSGDITGSHVLWVQTKNLPYVPSPLLYQGQLYLVKNGGLVSVLDAKTGTQGKQERVPGSGDYYASPVAGDGKVYLLNQAGELTVISAEPQWRVLATADFGEETFATPALVDGRIYLRTAGHLYCFGTQP